MSVAIIAHLCLLLFLSKREVDEVKYKTKMVYYELMSEFRALSRPKFLD